MSLLRQPGSLEECYQVINWLLFFLLGQFLGQKTTIQRYLCAQCGQEIASAHRLGIVAARERAWLIMKRLVALGKFKLFLSHRGIQQLISFVYSKAVSIAFVDGTVQGVGQRARQVLARLGDCRQRAAQVMMGDETFPKIISAGKAVAKSMAVVICEHGLIRAVRAVKDRKGDLERAFKAALGYFYQPDYFLSDYDKQYPALGHPGQTGPAFARSGAHSAPDPTSLPADRAGRDSARAQGY